MTWRRYFSLLIPKQHLKAMKTCGYCGSVRKEALKCKDSHQHRWPSKVSEFILDKLNLLSGYEKGNLLSQIHVSLLSAKLTLFHPGFFIRCSTGGAF